MNSLQIKGLEEALIATIVGALILLINGFILDWEWETWKYRNLARFGMCLIIPYSVFGLECFANVDVPMFAPLCGPQGAFNAGIAGILAYMLNERGEYGVRNFLVPFVRRVIK